MTKKINVDAPIVSIGMPVYNGEKHIRDAIESLLAQTFTNFELIISDNASTDNTEKICREYMEKDNRISYVRQTINLGAVVNFEYVLSQAKSENFMWAAYDDVWSNEYLSSAISLLKAENVDYVFPTFAVKSIKFGFYKTYDKKLFEFIDATDRKIRVLRSISLHHDSHKCNIVYSLFKTEFLKEALQKQNVGNDGALIAVIASMGRGKQLSRALFQKRYTWLWPGLLSPIYLIFRRRTEGFNSAKSRAFCQLIDIFPEYASEIKFIFDAYRPYSYHKGYLICDVESLLGLNIYKVLK